MTLEGSFQPYKLAGEPEIQRGTPEHQLQTLLSILDDLKDEEGRVSEAGQKGADNTHARIAELKKTFPHLNN